MSMSSSRIAEIRAYEARLASNDHDSNTTVVAYKSAAKKALISYMSAVDSEEPAYMEVLAAAAVPREVLNMDVFNAAVKSGLTPAEAVSYELNLRPAVIAHKKAYNAWLSAKEKVIVARSATMLAFGAYLAVADEREVCRCSQCRNCRRS
jgi:adenine/guanine phosphoribosyltransferase-like PRPP-binding protein